MPEAKFLDCILYSREQILKEYKAMPHKGSQADLPQVKHSAKSSTSYKIRP